MKGIMGFFARAKLIELSEDEQDGVDDITQTRTQTRTQTQTADFPPPVLPEPPPLPPAVVPPDSEEKNFPAIFSAANLPSVPFPAEKLLRLLDGLRAMDAATRKAAILAMDAADDSWDIADSVSDAQHKMAALEDYKQHLGAQLQSHEQHAAARLAEVSADLDSATVAIRQQIAELDQLLQRKITQSAQDATSVEADLRATRESVAREVRRMDAEIERLREISTQFTLT